MNSPASPPIWRGLLAILVGVIAVAWPGITIGAFVILFAGYAFLAAATEAVRAFRSESSGPVSGGLVLSVIDVAAGVGALVWPGITAYVLAVLVAGWAFIVGFFESLRAFSAGETVGERALLGSTGLILVALGLVFGLVLAVQPDVGAVTIAEVYGLFSIVAGISSLVIGANLRGAAPSPAGG
ncbi:MAG: protein of unknown function rane [Pseudonocardiales bacterium]|nr:protein of unknown function rane [Pseudonocardiales bacterium]